MKTLVCDTVGELLELGKSTAKKTGKAVVKTFNPLDKVFSSEDEENPTDKLVKEKKEKKDGKNFTPLDTQRLEKNYKESDKKKLESLRKHLFDLVKDSEKQAIKELDEGERRQKEDEERRKKEKEEKERKERERQRLQEEPHGKERVSIFSPKRRKKKTMVEYKPASGKN